MAMYVNNRRLHNELVRSKEIGRLTPEALEMVMKMVTGISRKFSYTNEDDRFDCQQHAMAEFLTYFDRYNPEKTTNAFAFTTQCLKNAMAKAFNKLHPTISRNSISLSSFHESL